MKQKNNVFELLLISTWFLGVMAVKFLLPSLPNIAEQFETTTLAKYTISIFLFGKATGMIVFGPLSEKYGRKPFMLLGLLLFSFGNILAIFASNITFLLFARLIQGFGVSATVMVGRAMINDAYSNKKAAIAFSHIFLVASIIIACLPMLGSLIASNYHWRMSFAIVSAYSFIIFICCHFFLEETHTKNNFQLTVSQVAGYYKHIVSHPLFLGYVLCSIFMIAGESAFNTASSFLLIKTMGLSKNEFGLFITLLAVGHLIGTLFCGRLVKRYALSTMMGIGVTILVFSTLSMLFLVNLGFVNLSTIMLPMIIYYVGTGFIMTITAVGAVIPFPNLIGISSAASLFLNFSFSAVSSAIMSHLSTNTAKPLSVIITFCGIAAFSSWYFLIVPHHKVRTEELKSPMLA